VLILAGVFTISAFTTCPHVCIRYMHERRDLYELARISAREHQDDERYAKLSRGHIARTGNTAREVWKLMETRTGTGRNKAVSDVSRIGS